MVRIAATHTTQCNKHCYMCDRPSDTFKHVHLPCEAEDGTPIGGHGDLVICIPCLSAMSHGLSTLISAYLSGGSFFDTYAQKRARRRQRGDGTPMPKYMEDLLRDLLEASGDDDA